MSIHITGVVQGVGFRPFVYGLATSLNLNGWIRNTSAGVYIEIDGKQDVLSAFIHALKNEAPPLARIDDFEVIERDPRDFREFNIVHSKGSHDEFQPISPDVGICLDCLNELFDPNNHRYRYPFINCTNCGPRFTIILDVPYDRPKTTMSTFEMCHKCSTEYEDPLDRRFHAQPIACPECGPNVWLEYSESFIERGNHNNFRKASTNILKEDAIKEARNILSSGKILAVKGLGGFHLACDATNPKAVAELRKRKLRVEKPFALMIPDIETVASHCELDATERDLLLGFERPVVILERRSESNIAVEVAPGQNTLGVMLPYTPLHYLLLEPDSNFPDVLVMTSGNISEEPIAYQNHDVLNRLAGLADAFLMHDRDIHIRCDDSVVRAGTKSQEGRNIYYLRRSRGYAPYPVHLPWEAIPLLAVGPELKNTFCQTNKRYAFISHHIGDMENFETLDSFIKGIEHFEGLFRVKPEVLAYDKHPNYMASRYAIDRAEREEIQAIGIQHHHAHIASCMVENAHSLDEPVIGISFDGTGYGDDGAIWGGEFLLSYYRNYRRLFHLAYVPMPGGELAIREPWRMSLAWLNQLNIDWDEDFPPVKHAEVGAREVVKKQIDKKINTPLTSSMGRLFDAVSAFVGVRFQVNYEAQAAVELEALVDPQERGLYQFDIAEGNISAGPLFQDIIADLGKGTAVSKISARFHNGVAHMVRTTCQILRERSGIGVVALSGGVWQNMTLLIKTVDWLIEDGFIVYLHKQVPPNDGGVSLGQAVVALQSVL
jgi:hydrogenase maturation protein HypF